MRRSVPSRWNARRVEIFSSPGQSSCLSMTQDGLSVTIRRMTLGGHLTTLSDEWIILNDPGDVGPDRGDGLRVVSTIWSSVRSDGGGAIMTPAAPWPSRGGRGSTHRGEAGGGDADDDRQFRRTRHALRDDADRLVMFELRRFAHDAEERRSGRGLALT